MSKDYISLTGVVVFNKILKPDVHLGDTKYLLTIALDKAGIKEAEKNGLATKEYEGKSGKQIQITAKRKIAFGLPKIYNADRDEVAANHLSLFGDKVTMLVKKGKISDKGDFRAYTYLERIRVDEKAEGVAEYDMAEF